MFILNFKDHFIANGPANAGNKSGWTTQPARKGWKKDRCSILTDTPEKPRFEENEKKETKPKKKQNILDVLYHEDLNCVCFLCSNKYSESMREIGNVLPMFKFQQWLEILFY